MIDGMLIDASSTYTSGIAGEATDVALAFNPRVAPLYDAHLEFLVPTGMGLRFQDGAGVLLGDPCHGYLSREACPVGDTYPNMTVALLTAHSSVPTDVLVAAAIQGNWSNESGIHLTALHSIGIRSTDDQWPNVTYKLPGGPLNETLHAERLPTLGPVAVLLVRGLINPFVEEVSPGAGLSIGSSYYGSNTSDVALGDKLVCVVPPVLPWKIHTYGPSGTVTNVAVTMVVTVTPLNPIPSDATLVFTLALGFSVDSATFTAVDGGALGPLVVKSVTTDAYGLQTLELSRNGTGPTVPAWRTFNMSLWPVVTPPVAYNASAFSLSITTAGTSSARVGYAPSLLDGDHVVVSPNSIQLLSLTTSDSRAGVAVTLSIRWWHASEIQDTGVIALLLPSGFTVDPVAWPSVGAGPSSAAYVSVTDASVGAGYPSNGSDVAAVPIDGCALATCYKLLADASGRRSLELHLSGGTPLAGGEECERRAVILLRLRGDCAVIARVSVRVIAV